MLVCIFYFNFCVLEFKFKYFSKKQNTRLFVINNMSLMFLFSRDQFDFKTFHAHTSKCLYLIDNSQTQRHVKILYALSHQ